MVVDLELNFLVKCVSYLLAVGLTDLEGKDLEVPLYLISILSKKRNY